MNNVKNNMERELTKEEQEFIETIEEQAEELIGRGVHHIVVNPHREEPEEIYGFIIALKNP